MEPYAHDGNNVPLYNVRVVHLSRCGQSVTGYGKPTIEKRLDGHGTLHFLKCAFINPAKDFTLANLSIGFRHFADGGCSSAFFVHCLLRARRTVSAKSFPYRVGREEFSISVSASNIAAEGGGGG